MVILPACSLPNNCKKIVLMKVCAVEKFDGGGGGRGPTLEAPQRWARCFRHARWDSA
jgi:hypothetical protein